MTRTATILAVAALLVTAVVSFLAGHAVGKRSAPATVVAAPAPMGPTAQPSRPLTVEEQLVAGGADPREVAMASEITRTAERWARLPPEQFQAELRAWEGSAQEVTYAQLERNAMTHIGKRVVYRAGILEIRDEPDGSSTMRAGLRRRYGTWDDPIWVTALNPPDDTVVAGSTVWVYGLIIGTRSYQSQAGWNISIPEVAAVAVVREERRRR